MAPQRKSYTIQKKLLILSEYEEGQKGKGLPSIAKKHGISRDTLRGWVANKDVLMAAVKDREVESRRTRRLEGGGRKTPFRAMEDKLYDWVREKNAKGLKVKDSYIKQKALNLHREMLHDQEEATLNESLEDDQDRLPEDFSASTGWITRFKDRRHLVSRRRTMSRVLPEDADKQVRSFIQNVHVLMAKHSIKYKNVINLDQVPRYFEVENGSTITKKGSKQVILRKGGTSHKRFTTTFAITATGDFLKPHILFSKLVNKPKVPSGILCDVNPTGMWNDEILWNFIKLSILSRKETAFSREPVLLILDAYGPHVTLVESDRLKAYNVFTIMVPERLTGVVQPLDVGLNWGFQSSYAAHYDNYISQALEDSNMQTAAGNPKVPNYYEVAQWVLEWIASVEKASVKKSFLLCGLLKDDFSLETLHKPLHDLLSGEFSLQSWADQHSELLELEDENANQSYLPPRWYLPEVIVTSLFECILMKLHMELLTRPTPNSVEIDLYRHNLIVYMKADEELQEITDDQYYKDLKTGKVFPDDLELFAICGKEKVNLKVVNDITKTDFIYRCNTEPCQVVELVKLDNYFAVLIQEDV